MKPWRTFSKQSKFISVSLIVIFFVALLQLSGLAGLFNFAFGWVVQPVVVPISRSTAVIKNTFSGVTKLRSLYVENAELKTRLQELELKLAAMSAVESENQVLKSTMGFVSNAPSELVPCTVLARDPDGLSFTLLLSCGEDEGVKVGQGVIAGGYLTGKIVLTDSKTSTARLLVSPSVAVDAKVLGRQASGVIKGSYGSGISLDLVSSNSGVTAGDLVTSAGVNELIPPDILIGTVSEIIRIPGALFDQISISSPVDLRDLRFVHVIKL